MVAPNFTIARNNLAIALTDMGTKVRPVEASGPVVQIIVDMHVFLLRFLSSDTRRRKDCRRAAPFGKSQPTCPKYRTRLVRVWVLEIARSFLTWLFAESFGAYSGENGLVEDAFLPFGANHGLCLLE